jgi:hypothetical protein
LVDAIDHALDEARGFVFLGETEGETSDRFGDVEGLPVVVVVRAVEELLVDALAGFLDEAFPNGIALFGRAEAKKGERGVREAVFGGGLRKHLGRDAARSEVDDVVAFEGSFAGAAVVFTEGVGDVAGLVRAWLFAGSGEDGTVWLDRV